MHKLSNAAARGVVNGQAYGEVTATVALASIGLAPNWGINEERDPLTRSREPGGACPSRRVTDRDALGPPQLRDVRRDHERPDRHWSGRPPMTRHARDLRAIRIERRLASVRF